MVFQLDTFLSRPVTGHLIHPLFNIKESFEEGNSSDWLIVRKKKTLSLNHLLVLMELNLNREIYFD